MRPRRLAIPHAQRRTHALLVTIERIFLFLLAFGVVVYLLISTGAWASEFKRWFWFTGDWTMYIYITLLLFVFSYVLRKLLIFQWRKTVR